jgi:hypothetical protein
VPYLGHARFGLSSSLLVSEQLFQQVFTGLLSACPQECALCSLLLRFAAHLRDRLGSSSNGLTCMHHPISQSHPKHVAATKLKTKLKTKLGRRGIRSHQTRFCACEAFAEDGFATLRGTVCGKAQDAATYHKGFETWGVLRLAPGKRLEGRRFRPGLTVAVAAERLPNKLHELKHIRTPFMLVKGLPEASGNGQRRLEMQVFSRPKVDSRGQSHRVLLTSHLPQSLECHHQTDTCGSPPQGSSAGKDRSARCLPCHPGGPASLKLHSTFRNSAYSTLHIAETPKYPWTAQGDSRRVASDRCRRAY